MTTSWEDNVLEEISTFKAGYSRRGEITILRNYDCDICKTEYAGPILHADSSEGEYGGSAICLSCLRSIITKMEKYGGSKS